MAKKDTKLTLPEMTGILPKLWTIYTNVIIVVKATKEKIVPQFIKHATIIKRKDTTLKCVGQKKKKK